MIYRGIGCNSQDRREGTRVLPSIFDNLRRVALLSTKRSYMNFEKKREVWRIGHWNIYDPQRKRLIGMEE